MWKKNKSEITVTGKVREILDEIATITGDDPVKILETLISNYYKEVTLKIPYSESEGDYSYLKIGKIANIHLRKLLESSKITNHLLALLQTSEYSKKNFDLQYPMLVKRGIVFESIRYYKKPLLINGEEYYMCSQWYETTVNDDRSYLLYWMENFQK